MKRELLLILSITLSLMLMANPVGQEEARKKAAAFLGLESKTRIADQLQLAESQEGYHVFNVGLNRGFVVISADDCAPDVLGYADSGSFDAQDIPENMKAWLEGYTDQIRWMKAKGYGKAGNRANTRGVKAPISPLIKTKWNQSSPYNLKCPDFISNGKCVTGCVATAMAQVIYYWGKSTGNPQGTTRAIPAYNCSTNWSNYGHISVPQIDITTFNWNAMKLSYSGNETLDDPAALNVANLMACCGSSVEMNYKNSANGGSGAASYDIPYALINYFGFANTTSFKNRLYYTSAEWEDLIYNELVSGRPVLYGGQSSGGGHEFVCDGYSDEGYFHINWGWGGKDDGHFLLSVLNPHNNSSIGSSSSKDGYSYDQDAIIGIQIGSGIDVEPEPIVMSTTSLSYTGNSGNYVVHLETYNYSGAQNTFDLGLGIFDNSNTLVKTINSLSNISLDPSYGYSDLEIDLDPSNIADGSYRIVGISKLASETDWHQNKNSETKYIQAIISGGAITLNVPTVSLMNTSIEVVGNKEVNSTQTVMATFTNNGTFFNNYLYLFFNNKKAGGKIFEIDAMQSTEFSIDFVPTVTGEDILVKIATNENGTNVIASTTVTITTASAAPEPNLTFTSNLTVNRDNNIIYGNIFKASFGIKNNATEDYTEGFVAKLYKVTSIEQIDHGFSYDGIMIDQITNSQVINPGETKTISFEFKDLEYEENYFCEAGYYSGSGTSLTFNTIGGDTSFYTISHGFVTIDSEGNVTATAPETFVTVPEGASIVDLRGQNTITTLTPNNNPNCLYLLDSNANVPNGITAETHNIIKGDVANIIRLTDGHDFFTPIDFTANTITYKRTITNGYDPSNSGGWTTICLPFNVTSVSAEENAIDWFHSANDEDKNFWLMAFSSDGANMVSFNYANSLEADKPYIITVPGDTWGDEWKLAGKELTFTGQNVSIQSDVPSVMSGDYFKFYGTRKSKTDTSIFKLNETGTNFVLSQNSQTVEPFRAFFAPTGYGHGAHYVAISFISENTTALIGTQFRQKAETGAIHNLQGVKVGTADQKGSLPKGIYIINGKKYIIK